MPKLTPHNHHLGEDWARELLVDLVLEFAALSPERKGDLWRTTRIVGNADYVEIHFDYLGEVSRYTWDGTREALEVIIRTAADSFGMSIRFERNAHGQTPWDPTN